MNNERTCQLCGGGPLQRFEVPNWTELWLCEACELYQYGQMVQEQAYSATYHVGYEKHRRQKVRAAHVRLNRFEPFLQTAGQKPRLLEVGCSVGCTLEAAAQRGWRSIGVDVSRDAVQWCKDRGLEAYSVGPLRLPFEDSVFDALCAWHVIEHVEDVRVTLKEWMRVLRPGGLLVIETPDAACPKARRLGPKYQKFWAPEHTYTFTKDNLAQFFEQAGLEILTPPTIGPLSKLHPAHAAFACGYTTYHWARKQAGIEKAFQLFGRKSIGQGKRGNQSSWTRRVA